MSEILWELPADSELVFIAPDSDRVAMMSMMAMMAMCQGGEPARTIRFAVLFPGGQLV